MKKWANQIGNVLKIWLMSDFVDLGVGKINT